MIKIHDQGVTARGSVVRLCGRECDYEVWPGVDQEWVREWPGMNQG